LHSAPGAFSDCYQRVHRSPLGGGKADGGQWLGLDLDTALPDPGPIPEKRARRRSTGNRPVCGEDAAVARTEKDLGSAHPVHRASQVRAIAGEGHILPRTELSEPCRGVLGRSGPGGVELVGVLEVHLHRLPELEGAIPSDEISNFFAQG